MKIRLLFFALSLALCCGQAAVADGSASPAAAQMRAALTVQPADARLKKLSDLAARLGEAEIRPALAWTGDLPELRERVVFSQAVVARWSALAPAAAFAHAAMLPESSIKAGMIRNVIEPFAKPEPKTAAWAVLEMKAGKARSEAIPLVAAAWARENVPEALAWAERLPAGESREAALHNIRFIWVQSDPVAARPHVTELPPSATRQALLMNIAGAWAALDPQAAFAWAKNFAAEAADGLVLSSALESWADRDPRPATEAAVGLPVEVRERMALATLGRWATQSPQAALEWLLSQADEPLQMRAAPEIMKVWAPTNPAEAAAWVRKQPVGATHDVAIHSFVDAVCEWDSELGIELATQLPDYPSRLMRVQQCLRFWLPLEPQAANQWIEASSFGADIKAEWRKGNLNAGASVEAIKRMFKAQ